MGQITEGDIFIETFKQKQKRQNYFRIALFVIFLLLIWQGCNYVKKIYFEEYAENKQKQLSNETEIRRGFVQNTIENIDTLINSDNIDENERNILKKAREEVRVLRDSIAHIKDAIKDLDLTNGDIQSFEDNLNGITRKLSNLIGGSSYDQYIKHGIEKFVRLKEMALNNKLLGKDAIIDSLKTIIFNKDAIIAQLGDTIVNLKKQTKRPTTITYNGIIYNTDSFFQARQNDGAIHDSLKKLNIDNSELTTKLDSIINNQQDPIRVVYNGVVLYSDRIIESDTKQRDTYSVHNKTPGFIGLFSKGIPLQINVTFDFKLQNGTEGTMVYISCEPPIGQKIPDTKPVSIKGKDIEYIQPLLVSNTTNKNLTVNFTLPAGFLYGKYTIKLYTDKSSEDFYHRELNIIE